MGRKRNADREGLESQADAVREADGGADDNGGIIVNDRGETGPVAVQDGPVAVGTATDGNGERKEPGPPRLNPPRYWLAVRDPQGGLTLIKEFRSLRGAVKEWSGAVRMARMFAAGEPIIVKVKVAHPLPTGAGAPE